MWRLFSFSNIVKVAVIDTWLCSFSFAELVEGCESGTSNTSYLLVKASHVGESIMSSSTSTDIKYSI
jgi:hypothetical protein